MGVIVQRHGDVGVAHDVLQRFGIHTGVCHTGAECVPLWHNKDKPENPCGARSWRLVLILFPLKNSFEMGSTGGGEKRGLHLKDKFSRARKDPSYEV